MSDGWKKWDCPPDMFTVEERLKTLQLTEDQADRMALTYYQVEMNRTKDKDTHQKWASLYVKTQAKLIKKELRESFVEDFQMWLQGRSKYCQPFIKIPIKQRDGSTKLVERKATPWGNKGLLHLPEVKDWLGKPVLNRDRVIKKIAELEMGPLNTIEDCWLYYKYITRGIAVDGDIIKEQRNYNTFDYMENRPMVVDPATGELKPDMRYTPMQIENPSMPKFDQKLYYDMYTMCARMAGDANPAVLHTEEYTQLMPADKIMVLSILSEADEVRIVEPAKTALREFVVDATERLYTIKDLPPPPVEIKKEIKVKLEKGADVIGDLIKTRKELEEKKLKLAEEKANKEAEEKLEEMKKQAREEKEKIEELKKHLTTAENPVMNILTGVIEPKAKELSDKTKSLKFKMKYSLDEFIGDPFGASKDAKEILTLFDDLREDMETYRFVQRDLLAPYKSEQYIGNQKRFGHDVNRDENIEVPRGEGDASIQTDDFINFVVDTIEDGQDYLYKGIMERITTENYFSDLFKTMRMAIHEGKASQSLDAIMFAINSLPGISEYAKRSTDLISELSRMSNLFAAYRLGISPKENENVHGYYSALSRIATGMDDVVKLRNGFDELLLTHTLDDYESPFMQKARKYVERITERDDTLKHYFKTVKENGKASEDFLLMEGPLRQYNFVKALIREDMLEETISTSFPAFAKESFQKVSEKLLGPVESFKDIDALDFFGTELTKSEELVKLYNDPDTEEFKQLTAQLAKRADAVAEMIRAPVPFFINSLNDRMGNMINEAIRGKTTLSQAYFNMLARQASIKSGGGGLTVGGTIGKVKGAEHLYGQLTEDSMAVINEKLDKAERDRQAILAAPTVLAPAPTIARKKEDKPKYNLGPTGTLIIPDRADLSRYPTLVEGATLYVQNLQKAEPEEVKMTEEDDEEDAPDTESLSYSTDEEIDEIAKLATEEGLEKNQIEKVKEIVRKGVGKSKTEVKQLEAIIEKTKSQAEEAEQKHLKLLEEFKALKKTKTMRERELLQQTETMKQKTAEKIKKIKEKNVKRAQTMYQPEINRLLGEVQTKEVTLEAIVRDYKVERDRVEQIARGVSTVTDLIARSNTLLDLAEIDRRLSLPVEGLDIETSNSIESMRKTIGVIANIKNEKNQNIEKVKALEEEAGVLRTQLAVYSEELKKQRESDGLLSDQQIITAQNELQSFVNATFTQPNVSWDSTQKAAQEKHKEIESYIRDTRQKTREDEAQLKRLQEEYRDIQGKINKLGKVVTLFESALSGKVKLSEEELESGRLSKLEHVQLGASLFAKRGEVVQISRKIHATNSKIDHLSNIADLYVQLFNPRRGNFPRLEQLQQEGSSLRDMTFEYVRSGIAATTQIAGNIFSLTDTQVDTLVTDLEALQAKTVPFQRDFTDNELRLVSSLKNTVDTLKNVKTIPADQRMKLSNREATRDEEESEEEDEEDELGVEDVKEGYKSGQFAKKAEKQEYIDTRAEQLIKAINYHNKTEENIIEITQGEEAMIQRYLNVYGKQARYKLDPDVKYNVTKKDIKEMQEVFLAESTESLAQKNVLEFARQLKEGKVQPNNVTKVLNGIFGMKSPNQALPDKVLLDKYKDVVIADIQGKLQRALETQAALDPSEEVIPRLSEAVKLFPDLAAKALTEDYVLTDMQHAFKSKEGAKFKLASQMAEVNNRDAIDLAEEEAYAEGVDTYEVNMEKNMAFLRDYSLQDAASDAPMVMKGILDGYYYNTYTSYESRPDLFTNEQFENEFYESIDNPKDRLKAQNILRDIHYATDYIARLSPGNQSYPTAVSAAIKGLDNLINMCEDNIKLLLEEGKKTSHAKNLIGKYEADRIDLTLIKAYRDSILYDGLQESGRYYQNGLLIAEDYAINVDTVINRFALSVMFKSRSMALRVKVAKSSDLKKAEAFKSKAKTQESGEGQPLVDPLEEAFTAPARAARKKIAGAASMMRSRFAPQRQQIPRSDTTKK